MATTATPQRNAQVTAARRRAVLLGVLVFLTSFLIGLCAGLVLQALW